jgi:hypothetical protein
MRLLLFCMILQALALVRSSAGQLPPSEFPFQLREGMLWVVVRVPETPRELEFLLDSGAEASVIDLQTARNIGLTMGTRWVFVVCMPPRKDTGARLRQRRRAE